MPFIMFIIAAIFFFLAAVSANLLPNPTAWGLVALAVAFVLQSDYPSYPRRSTQ